MADVIIIGGGFTGSALATALADGLRRVLVLEARPGPRRAFAGELIHPTGVAVLEALGVRNALEDGGAVPIDGFAVFPGPTSTATLLSYSGAPGVRGVGLAMDHDKMVAILRKEAERRPGVEIRFGARVVSLVQENGRVAGVTLEDGEILRAPLVLSAEGRHSRLRTALGIRVSSELLSYTAVVRAYDARLPYPDRGHIFLGSAGPILAYSLGNREARLCFDMPKATHPSELGRALVERYLPQLPRPLAEDVARALEREAPQLIATHAMRADRAVEAGMALVGDAGACAHPLTAGGMTLCLNDIQILARELAHRPIENALARYEQDRLEMLEARVALTDALYQIFSLDDPGMRAMREAVFRYWRAPRSKRASISLLAGAELRRSRLAAEYARVLGHALRTAPVASLKTALKHGATFLR